MEAHVLNWQLLLGLLKLANEVQTRSHEPETTQSISRWWLQCNLHLLVFSIAHFKILLPYQFAKLIFIKAMKKAW